MVSKDRLSAGRLAAGRTARRLTTRLLASPALKWRYGPPVAERILVQPQDLRDCDAAFASELATGALRLGGAVAMVRGDRPFDQPQLTDADREELHGFGWLRHLKAVGTGQAQADARRLIVAWFDQERRTSQALYAASNGVLARQLTSWLSVADFIAVGSEDETLELLLDGVATVRVLLAAHFRSAHAGWPRLQTAISLALYDTVIDGRGTELARSMSRLKRELQAHSTADGGALSRNAIETMEMALDLSQLHLALLARGLGTDDQVRQAIKAAVATLRHTSLGDRTLARFHGVRRHTIPPALLLRSVTSTVGSVGEPVVPVRNGYARLERHGVVVIMDVAPPPPLAVAAAAAAGCLAFEFSVGRQRVVGPACGVPASGPPDDTAWRSTAAHATLTLAGQSSSRRLGTGGHVTGGRGLAGGGSTVTARDAGAIIGPQSVQVTTLPAVDGAGTIAAAHDGYVASHGLLHSRRVTLSESGDRLTGTDRLCDRGGTVRIKQDAPFAVYFHIDPNIEVEWRPDQSSIELSWSDADGSQTWSFTMDGPASMALELSPGIDLGRQVAIVLRGATFGDTEISWSLARITDGAPKASDQHIISPRDNTSVTDAAPGVPRAPVSLE